MTATETILRSEKTDFLSFSQLTKTAVRYGPRLIILGIVGYASLGFCYHIGLIGYITQLAIPIIKSQVGYIGLGAVMPTFQWYLAWSIRIVSVIVAECLLECVWMICKIAANYLSDWISRSSKENAF